MEYCLGFDFFTHFFFLFSLAPALSSSMPMPLQVLGALLDVGIFHAHLAQHAPEKIEGRNATKKLLLPMPRRSLWPSLSSIMAAQLGKAFTSCG